MSFDRGGSSCCDVDCEYLVLASTLLLVPLVDMTVNKFMACARI